jgi:hypothetical protein
MQDYGSYSTIVLISSWPRSGPDSHILKSRSILDAKFKMMIDIVVVVVIVLCKSRFGVIQVLKLVLMS